MCVKMSMSWGMKDVDCVACVNSQCWCNMVVKDFLSLVH
jgi:hypothetical protein